MKFSDSGAIFEQIAGLLKEEIASGKRAEGDRLPSARELAASLQVNPNTAARALQVLADAGYARLERGSGYFVAQGGRSRLRSDRRQAFMERDLPHFFRAMESVGLDISDIVAAWDGRIPSKESAE